MRLTASVLTILAAGVASAQPPSVAVEAEEFTVESGWRVVQNGRGNYMVDVVGFNHISGERLLCVGATDATATAFKDVTVPVAGDYCLWVRYEYPPFCEARFRVQVRQGERVVVDQTSAQANR
jgi:hypothetical protein